MSERPPTLEEGVRRMQEALGHVLNRQADALERWAQGPRSAEARKAAERAERERRKKQKRLSELKERSPTVGPVMLLAAVACVLLAFITPLWWLIFVALGLGIGGVSNLGGAKEVERLEQELGITPVPAVEVDPAQERLARVDEVSRRLVRAFAEGPEALRALVARPEQTVESIRKGCHALAERERALRALAAEGGERLGREREVLAARKDAEQDPVTRERLGSALEAMDAQQRQRAELESHANRLEAEQVRLAWTLESLLTQVVRARSTSAGVGPVEDERVRQELARLTDEVGAVAEALEEAAGVAPVVGLPEVPDGGPGAPLPQRTR